MRAVPASICATIVLAAAVVAFGPDTAVVKCGNVPIQFPDAPEPVYVLNAVAVDRDSMRKIGERQMESVQVHCAGYIYQTFGIEAQRSGIVMFTKPGPVSALRAAMDSIAALQTRFLARTGRFAPTLSELGWTDAAGLITVDVMVAVDGTRWSATGKHRYLTGTQLEVTVEGRK
jgi:hypothetical protein